MMQAQRYGYTQMINTAILTNSSYKLRFAQDLTLYLVEIGLDIEGFDLNAGKKHWLEDPIWQGTRKAIEAIMGATDYLEQYFATNLIFEPLVGELFRSGFVMQMAASQNDFITPSVVSAAEGDYERNLANTVELIHMLTHDKEHGEHNRGLFKGWMAHHGALANEAANNLQPIWSQPRVKVSQLQRSARPQAKNRIAPSARKSTSGRLLNARDTHRRAESPLHYQFRRLTMAESHHDNIFKSMKDMQFEDTISHQCGVTMNDSVESRAIAEVMAEETGHHGHLSAGDDPHRWRPRRSSSRWTRSARRLVAR